MKVIMNKLIDVSRTIFLSFFLFSVLLVLLYRFINPPVTLLMLQRLTQQLHQSKPLRLGKKWMPLNKISSDMVLAVVASEDNNFLIHRGLDFEAISRAIQFNKYSRNFIGASTISQQTAKNVFLWPKRSYIRKGVELYFTLLIEIFWSKKRIIEIYLNIIELGNGIYGVEKASEYYYHQKAQALTIKQAAMLAAILPAPQKRNPSHPSAYLTYRRDHIISVMFKLRKVEF